MLIKSGRRTKMGMKMELDFLEAYTDPFDKETNDLYRLIITKITKEK